MLRLLALALALLPSDVTSTRPAARPWANTAQASITCTTDASGFPHPSYSEASFTITTQQVVSWHATFDPGYPADVGSCNPSGFYYLSTTSSSGVDIPLTTTKQTSGTKLLNPGTYYVGVRNGWMGPGTYTVTYDRSAALQVTPSSRDFGSVTAGGQSAAQTFTITSVGDLPATITSVTSSDPVHFPIAFAGGGAAPKTFSTYFLAGSAQGAFGATMTIHGNNPDVTVADITTTVSGVTSPALPNIACTGSSFLGTADQVAGTPIVGTRSYTNNGSATLVVTQVNVENDAAAVFTADTPPSTSPVGTGVTRAVAVRFAPPASGGDATYDGRLRIFSNDPDEPVKQCAFSATAHHPVPHLTVDPPGTLAFGRVPLTKQLSRPLTLGNAGDGVLQVALKDAWTGNPGYAPFRQHWGAIPIDVVQTVAPMGAKTFEISYAPQVAGDHAIAVGLESNDASAAGAQVVMTGAGFSAAPMAVALVVDAKAGTPPFGVGQAGSLAKLASRAGILLVHSLRAGTESFGAVTTRKASVLVAFAPLTTATIPSSAMALANEPGSTTANRRLALAISKAGAMLSGGDGTKTLVVIGDYHTAIPNEAAQALSQVRTSVPGLRVYIVSCGPAPSAALMSTAISTGIVNDIFAHTSPKPNWRLTSFYYSMYP
jgi:hypothetical protein